MNRQRMLIALLPAAVFVHAPRAAAETVPYWVTDATVSTYMFTASPDVVHESRFSDTDAEVDILLANASAHAGPAFASAYSEAHGSATGALTYTTQATARADAELNGLVAGNYRVSFTYAVLSPGENPIAGNLAAVGFEIGAVKTELLGTGGGSYSTDVALSGCSGDTACWIAFYAWSDSHAVEGIGSGNASIFDISVLRLPDTPTLPTPLPAGAFMLAPALALLLARTRRG